jgi:hypothetical protein
VFLERDRLPRVLQPQPIARIARVALSPAPIGHAGVADHRGSPGTGDARALASSRPKPDTREVELCFDRGHGDEAPTRETVRVAPASCLDKTTVASLTELADHQIITAPMGTVFPLDQQQWTELTFREPRLPDASLGRRRHAPAAGSGICLRGLPWGASSSRTVPERVRCPPSCLG